MKKYNNKNNNFYKRLITLLSIFRRISNGKKVKNDRWLIQHKIYFSITVAGWFWFKNSVQNIIIADPYSIL